MPPVELGKELKYPYAPDTDYNLQPRGARQRNW